MEREIYAKGEKYMICPIIDKDREDYVELKRQINGEKSFFLNPLSSDIMWRSVMEGTTKVFSIIDDKNEFCGSMELQNPESRTPEIGIDLLISKRNKGIAREVIKMLCRTAYSPEKVDYFAVNILEKNLHSQHVFEKLGAEQIGRKSQLDELREKLSEKAGDASENEKLLETIYELKKTEEAILQYRLLPKAFL